MKPEAATHFMLRPSVECMKPEAATMPFPSRQGAQTERRGETSGQGAVLLAYTKKKLCTEA